MACGDADESEGDQAAENEQRSDRIGDAILDYAQANHVDHLVLGARAGSLSRRLLGSVSGKVAAEAPCNVTVVRVSRGGG